MKVLHFLPALDRSEGGVVTAVLDLCRNLRDIGVVQNVATHRDPDRSGLPEGCESRLLPTAGPIIWGDDRRSYDAAVADHDVIHVHGVWGFPNVHLINAARRAGLPVVLSTHGMLDDWSLGQKRLKKRTFLRLFKQQLTDAPAAYHCTAAAERRQVADNLSIDPSRVRTIPYAIRLGELKEGFDRNGFYRSTKVDAPGASVGADVVPRVLYLSRLHPKKGVEILLDATAKVVGRGKRLELLIAGPGEADYVRRLERRSERLGLGDVAKFLGMVRGEERLRLYKTSDCFVLPTYQENFGIVLVEAMMADLPVITTRHTDIWEELSQCNAQIVDQNADALAQTMATVMDGIPDGRFRPDLEALNRWLDPQRISRQFVEMYESTLD